MNYYLLFIIKFIIIYLKNKIKILMKKNVTTVMRTAMVKHLKSCSFVTVSTAMTTLSWVESPPPTHRTPRVRRRSCRCQPRWRHDTRTSPCRSPGSPWCAAACRCASWRRWGVGWLRSWSARRCAATRPWGRGCRPRDTRGSGWSWWSPSVGGRC